MLHGFGPLIEARKCDYAPFTQLDGLGKAHQLFGDRLNKILNELNERLAVARQRHLRKLRKEDLPCLLVQRMARLHLVEEETTDFLFLASHNAAC